MEPVEVIARWQADGQVIPLQFNWQGTLYLVESIGRHWQDNAGLHVLVMAADSRVFELVFHPEALIWSVSFASPSRQWV